MIIRPESDAAFQAKLIKAFNDILPDTLAALHHLAQAYLTDARDLDRAARLLELFR